MDDIYNKCRCGKEIEEFKKFSFTHRKIKLTVHKTRIEKKCKKCSKENLLNIFDKYHRNLFQQNDGRVDWNYFLGNNYAKETNAEIIKLLKAMGILSTIASGNWEVVEYRTISCGWEVMAYKAIISPSMLTFGDPVFFTDVIEVIAFARLSCNGKWEAHKISEIYSP